MVWLRRIPRRVDRLRRVGLVLGGRIREQEHAGAGLDAQTNGYMYDDRKNHECSSEPAY